MPGMVEVNQALEVGRLRWRQGWRVSAGLTALALRLGARLVAPALARLAQLVREGGVHVRQPRLAGQLLHLRGRSDGAASAHNTSARFAPRAAPCSGRAPSASAASACAVQAAAPQRAQRRPRRRQQRRQCPKSCQRAAPARPPAPSPRRPQRRPARASCRQAPAGPCRWTESTPREAPGAVAGARRKRRKLVSRRPARRPRAPAHAAPCSRVTSGRACRT